MSEDLKYIEKISGLIIKYNQEELTDEEYRELKEWSEQSPKNLELLRTLSDTSYVKNKTKDVRDIQASKEADWKKIMSVITGGNASEEKASTTMTPVSRIKGINYLVAASLVGILTAGAWLYMKHRSVAKTNIQAVASTLKNDVAPGGNKATLTLSNGQQILLDDVKTGTLTEQGATQVIKKNAGTLSYATLLNEEPKKEELSYNMLTTPRAGTFLVELPDHSKVWLNAESSLRYPTHFDGQDTRTVELTGEAFFDISKDATHPFKVKVANRLIEVLGTTFNVQAYTDEQSMQTTLISGAVKVNAGEQARVLAPGQQAGISIQPGAILKVSKAENLRQITAWKDGLFFFHDDNIETVMRQLARWYDVDVVYEGERATNLFSGMIRRNNLLSDVLKVLALSGVHFRIEGKKIIVTP